MGNSNLLANKMASYGGSFGRHVDDNFSPSDSPPLQSMITGGDADEVSSQRWHMNTTPR